MSDFQSFLARSRGGGGAALQDLRAPNTAAQQYVSTVRSALNAWPRIYDSADRATIQSPMFWWQVRSDPIFAWAIQKRRQDVSGLEYWMKPADDTEGAKIVANRLDWLIRKTPDFTLSRYELCSGIFRGSAMAAITGERQYITAPGDNRNRQWWVPGKLVDVDRWRFALSHEPNTNLDDSELFWQLYSFKRRQWERIEHPNHFVWFFYENPESAMGYGYGLNNGLYVYLKAKEIALNLMLRGLRRWAMGIITAAVDTITRMGDMRQSTDTESIGQEYAERLAALNAEDVLVYDKADDVKVMTGGGEGSQLAHEALEYLDRGVLRYITHGDLTSGSGEAGVERGNATTQKKGQSEGFAWDVSRLEECLTSSFVAEVYRLNRDDLADECAAAGVPMGECAHLKIGRAQEEMEPTKALEVIEKAQKVGMRVPESWSYEKAGIPMPQEGTEDAVLEPPGSQPMGGGGAPAIGSSGVAGQPEALDTSEVDEALAPSPDDDPLAVITDKPTPDASEADQQASELLGKVGGIQGWMTIAQAVAAGQIPRETAIAGMVTFFRLSQDEASALIPEPNPQPAPMGAPQ